MVLQNIAGALAPAQGEAACGDQRPAGGTASPKLFPGQVLDGLRACRIQVPDPWSVREPEGQGVGRQEPVSPALAQLQSGSQNPEPGEIRQLLWGPEPAGR